MGQRLVTSNRVNKPDSLRKRIVSVVSNALLANLITGRILAGTAIFLYLYHIRTGHFAPTDRLQVAAWPFEGTMAYR